MAKTKKPPEETDSAPERELATCVYRSSNGLIPGNEVLATRPHPYTPFGGASVCRLCVMCRSAVSCGLLAVVAACASVEPDSTGAVAAGDFAPQEARDLEGRLSNYLRGLLAAGRFAGDIRVTRKGQVVLDARLGPRRTWTGRPIRGPIWAPVGSITKLYFVALCGRLMDAGLLNLETRIGPLLGHDGVYSNTTFLEILEHRTRFPREPIPQPAETDELSRCLASPPLPSSAAEGHYSNCAYLAGGAALSAHLATSLDQLMRTYVLDPLGLESTGFEFSLDTVAASFEWRSGHLSQLSEVPTTLRQVGLHRASGGLLSTVDDLERFFIGAQSNTFISKETRAALPKLARHAGRVPGYMAFGGTIPDAETVGIYLISVVDDAPLPVMIPDIRRIVVEGQPGPERTWRYKGMPTPSDALGECTGTYELEADPGIQIQLGPGLSASIRQGPGTSRFLLRLAEDGELHFVEPEQPEVLLPFSVVLESASDECASLKIRLNAGVAMTAVRQGESLDHR